VTEGQEITIELNPDERRVWDRLRRQIVAQKQRGARSGLADLLVLLPDLTVLTIRLLRDDRVPLASKGLAVAGVAYVLSPIDIVPVLLFGPIGLLDDLVVIASVLSSMLNRVHPDVVRSHWSGQGDALEAIQRVTGWVEAQATMRLRRIMARFGTR
jgi:uncharacterized membrane protein YkvA (DUF1232 family)